jgi:Secretion system C-terminal sorting domain
MKILFFAFLFFMYNSFSQFGMICSFDFDENNEMYYYNEATLVKKLNLKTFEIDSIRIKLKNTGPFVYQESQLDYSSRSLYNKNWVQLSPSKNKLLFNGITEIVILDAETLEIEKRIDVDVHYTYYQPFFFVSDSIVNVRIDGNLFHRINIMDSSSSSFTLPKKYELEKINNYLSDYNCSPNGQYFCAIQDNKALIYNTETEEEKEIFINEEYDSLRNIVVNNEGVFIVEYDDKKKYGKIGEEELQDIYFEGKAEIFDKNVLISSYKQNGNKHDFRKYYFDEDYEKIQMSKHFHHPLTTHYQREKYYIPFFYENGKYKFYSMFYETRGTPEVYSGSDAYDSPSMFSNSSQLMVKNTSNDKGIIKYFPEKLNIGTRNICFDPVNKLFATYNKYIQIRDYENNLLKLLDLKVDISSFDLDGNKLYYSTVNYGMYILNLDDFKEDFIGLGKVVYLNVIGDEIFYATEKSFWVFSGGESKELFGIYSIDHVKEQNGYLYIFDESEVYSLNTETKEVKYHSVKEYFSEKIYIDDMSPDGRYFSFKNKNGILYDKENDSIIDVNEVLETDLEDIIWHIEFINNSNMIMASGSPDLWGVDLRQNYYKINNYEYICSSYGLIYTDFYPRKNTLFDFLNQKRIAGKNIYDICPEALKEDYTSIETYSEEIILFPNPSSDFITLENSIDFEYTIYNSLGGIINSGIISGDGKINISNLEKGFYFIKTEDGRQKFIKK